MNLFKNALEIQFQTVQQLNLVNIRDADCAGSHDQDRWLPIQRLLQLRHQGRALIKNRVPLGLELEGVLASSLLFSAVQCRLKNRGLFRWT